MELFTILRKRLRERDVSQKDIALILGCHTNHVSNLLNKKNNAKFTLEDQYRIMDYLEWPYERMNEMFPKDGIKAISKARDEVREYCIENGKVLVDRGVVLALQALVKGNGTEILEFKAGQN